ncbi:MAG: EAL domain-containing protein [Lachnospiraceae bacterium]|nr:EAL domain-containing protein [Lachnospiraceae bacterium]
MKKVRTAVSVISVLSYVGFAVATFLENDFWIELSSPLTTLLCVVLILMCLRDLGRFKLPAVMIACGIGVWVSADILMFINDFALGMEEPQTELVRTLYLIPNYFFGASGVIFLFLKLKKRDLYITAANTFLVTVVGFAFVAKLIQAAGVLTENDPALFRVYSYFFVNIIILVIGAHILYMVGPGNLKKGTNLIPLCILGYIIIDFRYSYQEAVGIDPESIYVDLLYMLFLLGMTMGTVSQVRHGYVYVLKERDENMNNMIYVRVLSPLLLITAAVLRVMDILSQSEFSYILIAVLAYFIMYALLRNSGLNEKLLKQQQELNTALEAQVAEKTRDLKKANCDLEYLSSTDLLTGLYNRRHGIKALDQLVYESEKYDISFAVFGIDLNHFKPVNDTYGHEMGDRVLEEFGKRMRELPERFTSIRSGGDEFVILYSHVRDRDEVTAAAELLKDLFKRPIVLDSFTFRLSGSIGISLYPDDATDPEDLLQFADAAMYTVKRSKARDDYRFFDSGLVKNVDRRKKIEEELKKAEPERDFILHYQPQFDIIEGRVVGIEVFPRFKIPGFEDCTPAELIPIAEECGFMSRLGIWTAETALRQVNEWNRKYGMKLTTTINLAPLQLLDTDFINCLAAVIEQLGADPSGLILDVSNEVMMGAAESAKDTLRDFQHSGYTLSLNEFGGGDINLSYIKDCGFSTIKLSRTLIPQGIKDPARLDIILALLALAGKLKVDVVAVGIETDDQLQLMRGLGIRIMQGYYYGKPLPAGDMEKKFLASLVVG